MDESRVRNWDEVVEKVESTAKLHGNRVADLVGDVSGGKLRCPTCGEGIVSEVPDVDDLAERWAESVRKQMMALIAMVEVVDYNVEEMERQLMELAPIVKSVRSIIAWMAVLIDVSDNAVAAPVL